MLWSVCTCLHWSELESIRIFFLICWKIVKIKTPYFKLLLSYSKLLHQHIPNLGPPIPNSNIFQILAPFSQYRRQPPHSWNLILWRWIWVIFDLWLFLEVCSPKGSDILSTFAKVSASTLFQHYSKARFNNLTCKYKSRGIEVAIKMYLALSLLEVRVNRNMHICLNFFLKNKIS